MAEILATVEYPAEVVVAVDEVQDVTAQFDTLAIETIPDFEKAVQGLNINVSVDNNVGTPSATVSRTQTEETLTFDIAFSNLRGNGITDVSLISSTGLERIYRVTTDSGDYYDMVLHDGNGIASTSYSDGSITFVFTDGTSYTTPNMIPYIIDDLIDDEADEGTDITWSVTKIKQVVENSGKAVYNTTAGWNSTPTLVAQNEVMYVYTDGLQYSGGYIPRIKIGDGSSYLIDLPFLNEEEIDHINNQLIHVSAADRLSWNNKVTTYEPEEEILLITKD